MSYKDTLYWGLLYLNLELCRTHERIFKEELDVISKEIDKEKNIAEIEYLKGLRHGLSVALVSLDMIKTSLEKDMEATK